MFSQEGSLEKLEENIREAYQLMLLGSIAPCIRTILFD